MFHRLASLSLLVLLCQCQPYLPPTAAPPYPSASRFPAYPRYPAAPAASDAPAYPAYPAYPTDPSTAPPAPPPAPATAPLFPSYPAGPSANSTSTSSPAQPLLGGARHLRQTSLIDGQSLRLDLVFFDTRQHRLRVIDQPNSTAGGRVISPLMRSNQAIAGINGGFFTPDFQPMGLVIANGQPSGRLSRSGLISGAIAQTATRPRLIWNSELQSTQGFTDLLQAGPRLVHERRPVSGLDTSKKRPRSFIAWDGSHSWVIGTTDSCSLATLAALLATPGTLPGLSVQRALNLDGGRSTALWFRTADGRETSSPGWSTVRNYLAIVPN